MLYIKNSLKQCVVPLELNNDRMMAVEITLNRGNKLFLFVVYLPDASHPIQEYDDYLSELGEATAYYQSQGTIIVAGDFNSQLNGDRCQLNRLPKRSHLLQAFVDRYDLMSLTTWEGCSGATYSFDPFCTGINRTLIDHVMMPICNMDTVVKCAIFDDIVCNPSDHLPVLFTIKLDRLKSYKQSNTRYRYKWNAVPENILVTVYGAEVQNRLENIHKPSINASHSEVDSYYNSMVSSLNAASQHCIPRQKFNPKILPGWNKYIKAFHKTMLAKRAVWISHGKPRGTPSLSYVAFKDAKTRFRRELRCHHSRLMREFYNDIDTAAEGDQNLFWSLLNRNRKRKNCDSVQLSVNGTTYRDPNDIRELWASYYEQLYIPCEQKHFDDNHKKYVVNAVNCIAENHETDEILCRTVTSDEVNKLCKNLVRNKAPGYDGIENEHLKYGGIGITSHLVHLYNLFIKTSHVPDNAKRGILVNIHKAGKAKAYRENYRGITLLCVIYKLFERLMLERIHEWAAIRNVQIPHPLQCAYQKNLCSLMTSFTLQEATRYAVENGSHVYTAFLDTAKAFDTVWHDGLFYKLAQLGIKGKAWHILRDAYTNIFCCVFHDGEYSRWFPLGQGVRQGGVLSTFFYLVYIDELIHELEALGCGLKVGDIYVGTPVQADDLAMLTLSPHGLQYMLNTVFTYSSKWRYSLNASKSAIMVQGESTQKHKLLSKHRIWTIGGIAIPQVTEYRHVGVDLTADLSTSSRTESCAKRLRSLFMSILGPGVLPIGMNPITAKKILFGVCIPSALYGCELWCQIPNKDHIMLERAQRFCLKVSQGLNKMTRTDFMYSLIGALPIEATIDKQKLTFLARLLRLPPNSVPFKLFQFRLINNNDKQSGFIAEINAVLRKYELSHVLDANFVIPSKYQWKQCINKAVKAYQQSCWMTRIDNDYSLSAIPLMSESILGTSRLWRAALKFPERLDAFKFLAKMLYITLCIDNFNITCGRCMSPTFANEIVHVLTECSFYSYRRKMFWENIRSELCTNRDILNSLTHLTKNALTIILLGGNSPQNGMTLPENVHLRLINVTASHWYLRA